MTRWNRLAAALAVAGVLFAAPSTALAQADTAADGGLFADSPGAAPVVGLIGLVGLVFLVMAISDGDDDEAPESP
jgi:hypothetical protein